MIWGWKTDQTGHVWWRIRNSWGKSWAAGGNAWFDSSYPIWEAWSLTCVAEDPVCQQVNGFIAYMQANKSAVISRLEAPYISQGLSAVDAAAKATTDYENQINALTNELATLKC
jgi:hypothetical protein